VRRGRRMFEPEFKEFTTRVKEEGKEKRKKAV
jgi:hypothetical protein